MLRRLRLCEVYLKPILAASALLLSTGCPGKWVLVPNDPSGDKAPVITLTAISTDNTAGIEQGKDALTDPAVVNVNQNSNLTFLANATNHLPGDLGGVKAFALQIAQTGSSQPIAVSLSATKDGSGKAPDSLIIAGMDGNGGAGTIPLTVSLTSQVTVNVNATNFNNAFRAFTVIYVPVDPRLRGGVVNDAVIRLLPAAGPFGTAVYKAVWPTVPVSGSAVNLMNPSTPVLVLKKGQHDCSNSDSWTQLNVGDRLYDLTGTYGEAAPQLPIEIQVCPANSLRPEFIEIHVAYSLK